MQGTTYLIAGRHEATASSDQQGGLQPVLTTYRYLVEKRFSLSKNNPCFGYSVSPLVAFRCYACVVGSESQLFKNGTGGFYTSSSRGESEYMLRCDDGRACMFGGRLIPTN